MIGEVDVAAFEVGLQRRGHVVVVVADLRGDEGVGVFFSVRRRQPLHVGGPERDRLVAARDRPKANGLVVGELLFEGVFAILECVGHVGLFSLTRSRTRANRSPATTRSSGQFWPLTLESLSR